MACPGGENNSACKVKGNISGNSGNKFYFTERHPNYSPAWYTRRTVTLNFK